MFKIPHKNNRERKSRITEYVLPYIAIFSQIVLSTACSDTEPVSSKLVVEGYIESDGYPVVCLMRTISPDEEGTSISDAIVRWGKVTISDGEKTEILTGGMDKRFFPPYTYTTYEIKGEVGKTYTLTAEYGGQRVTATTRIPPVAENEDIRSEALSGDMRRLTLSLIAGNEGADGDGMEYYRVLTRVRDENVRLLPGFMGTASNDGRPGLVSIPVNRPISALDTADYVSSFRVGEEIEVALCTMERAGYEFWRDYDNAAAFGTSQFLAPSTPLRSNIKGGYGYFFGYGCSRRFITVD